MNNKYDDYVESFYNEDDFKNGLAELKSNREWFDVKAEEVEGFTALEFSPLFAYPLAEENGFDASMVEDTMRNSGFMVQIGGKKYLLRDTAVYDFLSRAGFVCTVAGKLSHERLSDLLTEFIHTMKKDIKINYCYGKLTAALSQQYVHVDEEALLKILRDELKSLGKTRFRYGSITCSQVEFSYDLDNKLITNEYADRLEGKFSSISAEDITPEIELKTGSSGDSAIKVNTFFRKGTLRVRIGQCVSIIHKGEPLEKFKKEARMLYPKFLKDIETFEKLLDIDILYPREAADNMFAEVGLKKKSYTKYVNNTLNFISTYKIRNAHDLYWGMSQILEEMKKGGESAKAIEDAEDLLYKVLRLDFKKYDFEKKEDKKIVA